MAKLSIVLAITGQAIVPENRGVVFDRRMLIRLIFRLTRLCPDLGT